MIPNRYMVNDKGVPRYAMGGDGPALNLKDAALTTAGAGTILAANMISGLIVRTGPTGAVTDTLDSAANLIAAFPTLQPGDTIDFWHSVNVAFAVTIAAGAGGTMITAATNNIIGANAARLVHIEILTVGATPTYEAYVI